MGRRLKLPRNRSLRLAFIAALFLVGSASTHAFETPMPAPQYERSASDATIAEVPQSALRARTFALPGNRSYEWTAWFQLNDTGASGENVAVVAQAYHKGTASTWALNSEVQCLVSTAGCFGHENDIGVIGPLVPGTSRMGAMNLAANLDPSKGTAVVDVMYLISELPYRADTVVTLRGVAIEMQCTLACLTVRAGQKIGLTEDGSAAIRFNPVTRQIEFYIDGTLVNAISKAPTKPLIVKDPQ